MDALTQSPRWPAGPDWRGMTVAIMASGPSLTAEQAEIVRGWREDGDDRRVIVINTTFRLAPWADMLYACDDEWWDFYIPEVRESFRGELWTQDRPTAALHHINWVKSERSMGLGRKPGIINQGGNSGFQAMNVAWQAGAARMILLGFDMQATGGKSHWHGNHPPGIHCPEAYPAWIAAMRQISADLYLEGVPVVNCSVQTALTCFPRESLEAALAMEVA